MTPYIPLWMRAVCTLARGLLAFFTLLVAFIAGAFVIVPLAIFVLPLVAILGGLLVLIVLAATGSMAEDWQAARVRRRETAAGRGQLAPAPVRRPAPGARAGR
jgi:hypothetical protein